MALYKAKSTKQFYDIIKKDHDMHSTFSIERIDKDDPQMQIVNTVLSDTGSRLNFNFVIQYYSKCKYHYYIHDKNTQMKYYIFQTHAVTKKEKEQLFNTIRRIATLKRLYNIAKNMNIFILMNPIKRLLPKHEEVINTQHINGGFTFTNRNEIFIIRKEDYDKVLIHEFLHHNTHIHFEDWKPRIIERLKIHFNISRSCELLPNEAVIEAFACLINTAFYAIETNTNFRNLLEKDQDHSLQIAKKILRHQNGKAWYELTNAYCYTVLKTIIYVYFDKFLKIYECNNDTLIAEFLIRQSKYIFERIREISIPNIRHNRSLKLTCF